MESNGEDPTDRAKGCLRSLLLLMIAYYLASIILTLALGFLFPWDPPVAEGSPRGAVLRVTAPEDEPFRVSWGIGFNSERGEVPSGDAYVDYAVPYEAVDEGDNFDISIEAGSLLSYESDAEEVDLGAILFVDGEYATCAGGTDSVDINWDSYEGTGGALTRTTCGSHRWAGLFPDPLSWIGL